MKEQVIEFFKSALDLFIQGLIFGLGYGAGILLIAYVALNTICI